MILSMGSNLGDRLRRIFSAIERMPLEVDSVSNLYRSNAMLLPGSPESWKIEFFNIAIAGWTNLCYRSLLTEAKKIENQFDRSRKHKWSPRTIDIDIIFWNDDAIINESDIAIPHHAAHVRDFVMVPICNMYPGFRHPVLKKKVSEITSTLEISSLTHLIDSTRISNVVSNKEPYPGLLIS